MFGIAAGFALKNEGDHSERDEGDQNVQACRPKRRKIYIQIEADVRTIDLDSILDCPRQPVNKKQANGQVF